MMLIGYKQARTKLRLGTRPVRGQSVTTFDLAMAAWFDLPNAETKALEVRPVTFTESCSWTVLSGSERKDGAEY